jgi:hypothetical protein
LLASLVPRDQGVSPQGIVILDDGTWVSSQGDAADNLTLTQYSHDGTKRLGELLIPGAGHGDRMRAEGQTVGVFVTGIWCKIPWQTGTLAAATAVNRYRSIYGMLPFGAREWFQGEITNLDDVAIRMYGVPFRGYGPSVVDGVTRPNLPTRLEFYKGSSAVIHTEDLTSLGRDDKGVPIDDRLEPEGLSVGLVDGNQTLIVGIVTGRVGHTGFTHRVYGRAWQGPPN